VVGTVYEHEVHEGRIGVPNRIERARVGSPTPAQARTTSEYENERKHRSVREPVN
jgi:hypothetical protein